MSVTDDPHTWRGVLARGTGGVVLGHVDGVFFDDSTGRATWAAVNDGAGTAVVPLDHAVIDGADLFLPYWVEQLATAPRHDLRRHLEPHIEQALRRHYDPAPAPTIVGSAIGGPDTADAGSVTAAEGVSAEGSVEVVRSQEQLRVGVARRVYGRARLVTYLVTEDMTFTVPVRRQEVRLEPVPLGDADRPDPRLPVGELVEDVHEVVLHREEVRFTTTVVPSERVRLVRRIVTRRQPITTQLRHEQIDFEQALAADDGDTATPIRGIAASST